jgi:NADH-quinone oxidoreductase subunit M
MPVFSAFFLFFALSAMGLPGLNNFVGEILILVGTFRERPIFAALAFTGFVFAVIYLLRMIQDALFGPDKPDRMLWDVTPREVAVLVMMALPVLYLGLRPAPVLSFFEHPAATLISHVARGAGLAP